MEIRPGDEGPYLLLTAGDARLVLQDKDDPRVYGGLFILCYDEGAEALSLPPQQKAPPSSKNSPPGRNAPAGARALPAPTGRFY